MSAMDEYDRKRTPSPSPLISSSWDIPSAPSVSSSQASQRRLEHSHKASQLPDTSMQTTLKRYLSQNSQNHRQILLEDQLRDLLALFDKTVVSAIKVESRSHDSSDYVTACALDDCLFEFRMWLENIKAIMPNTESFPSSLRVLDKLEEPVASNLRDIFSNLGTDLTILLASCNDTEQYVQFPFPESLSYISS